ncbi:MAG: carbamoyl-phosphate synthase small subunit, partial [Candidatus Thiodiazotropha taylori]|nr:carbamoyl-phosphate synthase small subunit [Candidatus Thiodiazotropha taylori]
MTSRSLLVDTNRAAVPIYRALRELGHEVWVVGNRPTETLAKLAQNYTQLDYSDTKQLGAFVE